MSPPPKPKRRKARIALYTFLLLFALGVSPFFFEDVRAFGFRDPEVLKKAGSLLFGFVTILGLLIREWFPKRSDLR